MPLLMLSSLSGGTGDAGYKKVTRCKGHVFIGASSLPRAAWQWRLAGVDLGKEMCVLRANVKQRLEGRASRTTRSHFQRIHRQMCGSTTGKLGGAGYVVAFVKLGEVL